MCFKIILYYGYLHQDDEDQNEYNEYNNGNSDFEKIKRFMKEYEIMSQISHQNILKTYGICYGDSSHPPSILLEYCPTNLKKMIQKLTTEEKERIISEIIHEIISGMSYLHSRGIIHRDLKPENILIDSSKHVKICDFCLCTTMNEHTHTQGIGTLSYMSPELLNENELSLVVNFFFLSHYRNIFFNNISIYSCLL
ncbi:CAMK family protein kinase [Tritrichomonas foetus]|uniref:CAMK family protein kinase n=1 Tax=Tritrichomonas foetus TaxID=1144522 RepID=A0A1J4JCN1_9EUKA|nr:CAMK family protein kinase [Tritrichomonas foetus]|eukprot:OHS96962.1 CAMK family protein kinase [Tritrichomonas foetus]